MGIVSPDIPSTHGEGPDKVVEVLIVGERGEDS